MKFFLFSLCAAVLFAVAGCGPSVMVDGESYYALTPDEEQMLVAHARTTLRHSRKAVKPEMIRFALQNPPAVKIDYRGDRAGIARVEWRNGDTQIAVVYTGEFLTPRMYCVLEGVDLFDGVLDYTGSKPVRRELPAQPQSE